MSHREVIIGQLVGVFRDYEIPLPTEFKDDIVLLDSGLDSLGFAILVTKLCDKLGFDPFVESDTPFYPSTLGEFIAFYDAREL